MPTTTGLDAIYALVPGPLTRPGPYKATHKKVPSLHIYLLRKGCLFVLLGPVPMDYHIGIQLLEVLPY
jgi:hypothetical protein